MFANVRLMTQIEQPVSPVHRTQLAASGLLPRELRRLVDVGEIRRIHRGWYVPQSTWKTLYTEQRHHAHLRGVAQAMRSENAVFSHSSAAVLWGLPLFRWHPRSVHTTLRHGIHVRSAADVVRHRDALHERDVTEINGVRCTSLARTSIDVARLAPLEAAVAALDAAFRRVAGSPGGGQDYDVDRAERFRDDLSRRLVGLKGARGVCQARWVVGFADGRAQLPGESVSRLYLDQLGFARPRLQVAVAGPAGSPYFIDFELDGAWGEFDGIGKYTDPNYLRGRSPAQALEDEKRREDWIRGVTGRRVVRWTFEHLDSASALSHRLGAFGIHPSRAR